MKLDGVTRSQSRFHNQEQNTVILRNNLNGMTASSDIYDLHCQKVSKSIQGVRKSNGLSEGGG